MPVLHIWADSEAIGKLEADGSASDFTAEATQVLARGVGKSESKVQVVVSPANAIAFAGSLGNSVYIEAKSIGGFTSEQASRLSDALCGVVRDFLGVDKERVYIEFQGAERHLFGHAGKTFV